MSIHWRKARGYEVQRRGSVERQEPHDPALDKTLRRIGFRARLMRENLGWSIAKVARAADIAPETLVRLEAGRHIPRLDVLVRLAAALGADDVRVFFI